MSITTRLASFEDIPLLNEIIVLSFRRLSKDYNTPKQIESSIKHIFGVDTQLVKDGTYYVADLDGIVVGCGGWSKMRLRI